MNIEDSKDPWNQGQKQVSVKIPGWVAFLVKAPFRLVFGLLGASRALNQGNYQEDNEGKRYVGDAQYYQDVDIYGESQAMYRATHNIKN